MDGVIRRGSERKQIRDEAEEKTAFSHDKKWPALRRPFWNLGLPAPARVFLVFVHDVCSAAALHCRVVFDDNYHAGSESNSFSVGGG